MERWEGFGSLGAGGAVFRQAGHGSPSHPDGSKSTVFPTRFSRPCNQPPAAHPCLAGLGGHPGGSEGDQRRPKRLFKLFPTPPAALPEAAVSRVNLGQFKESLSGARRMMNVETITGEAPWSCLKLSSPM